MLYKNTRNVRFVLFRKNLDVYWVIVTPKVSPYRLGSLNLKGKQRNIFLVKLSFCQNQNIAEGNTGTFKAWFFFSVETSNSETQAGAFQRSDHAFVFKGLIEFHKSDRTITARSANQT